MNWDVPGSLQTSVKTLGRALLTIGIITFLSGFSLGAYMIVGQEPQSSYYEWPFTFAYLPMVFGLGMSLAGVWLWYQRWQLDVEIREWINAETKKQNIPVREIDGRRLSFDPEIRVENDGE